jgi:hypothetical protein
MNAKDIPVLVRCITYHHAILNVKAELDQFIEGNGEIQFHVLFELICLVFLFSEEHYCSLRRYLPVIVFGDMALVTIANFATKVRRTKTLDALELFAGTR